MISPYHIWLSATGGGLMVEYLRWLAAMWEQFVALEGDEDFEPWLAAKFNSASPTGRE